MRGPGAGIAAVLRDEEKPLSGCLSICEAVEKSKVRALRAKSGLRKRYVVGPKCLSNTERGQKHGENYPQSG